MIKKVPHQNGKFGLPILLYAIYNIGNSGLENLLDMVHILSEELARAKALLKDYNFKTCKRLVLI